MSMLTFMLVDPAINRDKLMKVIMNYYVLSHLLEYKRVKEFSFFSPTTIQKIKNLNDWTVSVSNI